MTTLIGKCFDVPCFLCTPMRYRGRQFECAFGLYNNLRCSSIEYLSVRQSADVECLIVPGEIRIKKLECTRLLVLLLPRA